MSIRIRLIVADDRAVASNRGPRPSLGRYGRLPGDGALRDVLGYVDPPGDGLGVHDVQLDAPGQRRLAGGEGALGGRQIGLERAALPVSVGRHMSQRGEASRF